MTMFSICLLLLAQNPDVSTPQQARDLFLQGLSHRDLKVKRVSGPAPAAAPKPAAHFGVRYNLLLVTDPANSVVMEVDPDHNFKKGDCMSMRFMPNRDGFLYVFNQGSSGNWAIVLPSPEMKGEPPVVSAGVETTVPLKHCLRVEDPPGVENLMVVITDSESAVGELNQAMKTAGILQPTLQRLASAAAELGSRDLSVVRMSAPLTEQGAPPKSVYIVKALAGRVDTLSLHIKVRHE